MGKRADCGVVLLHACHVCGAGSVKVREPEPPFAQSKLRVQRLVVSTCSDYLRYREYVVVKVDLGLQTSAVLSPKLV